MTKIASKWRRFRDIESKYKCWLKLSVHISNFMVTSSHENTFPITAPFWDEAAGHRWIPLTKAKMWEHKQAAKRIVELPVTPLWSYDIILMMSRLGPRWFPSRIYPIICSEMPLIISHVRFANQKYLETIHTIIQSDLGTLSALLTHCIMDSQHKDPIIRSLDCFFVTSLVKLLNNKVSGQMRLFNAQMTPQ